MSAQSVNRSVFVCDLSPETTETDLLNAFCTSGAIRSVRVVRDRQSGQSLGHGYVNFMDERGARVAIDDMNFTRIKDRQIRVMAQLDPNLLKSSPANVFVKNLDKSVDNKRLFDLFRRFGPIVSSKVAEDESGQSKGHGFVQFECEQSARTAILCLNNYLLEGKPLYCCKFLAKNERQKLLPKNYCNVYVKNFGPDIDEHKLEWLFNHVGKVKAIKVVHKNDKHYAFIGFESATEANDAVSAFNGKSLPNGNAFYVSRAYKRLIKSKPEDRLVEKREECRGVYVKYLSKSFDEHSLKQLFAPFGPITSAYTNPRVSLIYPNETFGFVVFASKESALNAVKQMNNKIVANRPLYVAVPRPVDLQPWIPLKSRPLLASVENGRVGTYTSLRS